ncbi:unnamed protein product [Mytilus coruscus]|uniref:Uncharacterized protein n=1 Tax=Mytilus coruscus TaxID=42192 RepID=A0A6J8ADC8_MYTCO|nr:unnamed protein product [Mytilus coruscus]
MLNGRIGKQNYTNISSKVKSVVDYILIPHDQINDIIDFQVHTMSNIISRFDLACYESIPDHSLLECTISTYAENTDTVEQLSGNERLKAPRRFRYDGLRNELFSDEPMQKILQDTILRLENALDRRRDVDSAFKELKNLLVTEIELAWKLGLANKLKTQRIYQVPTENDEVTNDTDTVLERWKTEYESAFNSVDSCNNYDDTFLADIKNIEQNENNYRNDIDVSDLNREISREEVKDAVYKAKLGKAIGIDEIPSEIFAE